MPGSRSLLRKGPANLHVWRKTVTTAQAIPAKYELGELQTGSFQFVGSGYVTWEYGTPNVGDDGTVSLVSLGSSNVNYSSNLNDLRGKYCKPNQASGVFLANQVIFIPSDAVFTQSGSAKYISKYQPVIGTPKIPAGTTTTYPVSTNPNAYQEGNDAKPAGYTLGEVVTGNFRMSDTAPRNAYLYKYANSVAVNENGGVVLQNPEAVNFNSDSHIGYESTVLSLIAGKFLYYYRRDSMAAGNSAPDTQPPFNATPSEIVYVPADAAITSTNTYPAGFYLDKYQPVTGYAAIPAGTTIEYLGKLGDKARVQVISYVGTGTYGSSNPNSLTFDFVPKAVFLFSADTYNKCFVAYGDTTGFVFDSNANIILHVSWDGKNISWFNTDNDLRQHNVSGYKYRAIAIG